MKRITIVLLSVLLVASLFVSCKVEVDDPMADLVSIRFTDDDGSKGLNVSVPGLDEYTWYYKANKNSADGTGLKTGATGEDFVIIGGETGSGKLSEKAGPFSQGLWDFELQARNGESIVYTGKVSAVSVNKETTTVKVVVEPSQTGENGYLVIPKNIPLYDATNNVATNYKMVVSITNLISGKTVDVANVSTDNNYEKYSLEPASYRVSLTYQSEEGTYIYGSSETVVTIYSNMTTTLGGSVDENTSNVAFGPDGTIVVAPTEITTNNGVKEVTVAGSPADETKTTTVNFGDASGSITDGAKLSATMYPRQAAAKGFSVTDGNGVVLAGIDLKVEANGTVVSNFDGKAVTVSTYIGTGYNINDLKVFYTDGTEHEIVSYVDGVLTFKTTHFSSFYVVNTAVVALNETQNTLYTTLENAFDSANDGDVIVLQKGVVLSKTVEIADGRAITLDLNGFCIDLNSKIFSLKANGEKKGGSLNIEGKGKIRNTSTFVFVIFGATDSDGYSCKLSIGKDVDIEGTYAISIYSADGNSCYNVNVDVYGRISGEQPIYVDGKIKNSNKAVQLNIHDNARVVCSDGRGIYLAGYAKTSIGEAKIESDGNAISIAAGELEVNGATIEGGSEEGFNAGSGGSISTKEASAIYAKQHDTNLPLKVVVNSGSFSAYIPLYQDKGQNGDSAAPKEVKIEIKGGEFKCNSEIEGSVSVKSEDKTSFITGGTFNSNPSKYVAEGYVAEEDDDNNYVIRKLKEGEETINNVEGFKSAVVNGGTYILSENISLDEFVTVSSSYKVVLNLNGKTVDLNGHQASLSTGVSGGILISKDSSLEIEGNGIIKSSKGMFGNEGSLIIRNGSYLVSDYATIIRNSGKVEISDGLFVSKYPVLFMYGNSEQTINGGTFNSGDYYTVYVNGTNTADTPVSLTINGGEFKEFLYLAGYSKTLITGGSFLSPSNNPIHLKSGNIKISGGNFNCSSVSNSSYDYLFWSDGSGVLQGDVVIEACDYPAGNPSVSVDGGTFVNGLHYYQKPELKKELGEVNIKEEVPNVVLHKDFSYSKKITFSYYDGSELKSNSAIAYFYSEEKADAFTMETVIEGITLVSVGEKVALTK